MLTVQSELERIFTKVFHARFRAIALIEISKRSDRCCSRSEYYALQNSVFIGFRSCRDIIGLPPITISISIDINTTDYKEISHSCSNSLGIYCKFKRTSKTNVFEKQLFAENIKEIICYSKTDIDHPLTLNVNI